MCNITDEQLKIIMYFITLKNRSKNSQKWIQSGFKKIKPESLLKYWSDKMKTDEKINTFICDIWDQYNLLKDVKETNKLKTQPLSATLPTAPPPLGEKVKTFTKSVIDWGKNGLPITSKDDFEKRLNICKSCEFWDKTSFNNTGKCNKCGCSTQMKLKMDTAKCPIGKW